MITKKRIKEAVRTEISAMKEEDTISASDIMEKYNISDYELIVECMVELADEGVLICVTETNSQKS